MSMVTNPDGNDTGADDTAPPHGAGNRAPDPTAAVSVHPIDGSDPSRNETTRRPRRRWPFTVTAGLLLAATAGGAYTLLAAGSEETADQAGEATIRAVTAEQRDLIEYTDLDGRLGWAEVRPVSATGPGTITTLADDGDLLERGDTIHAVDTAPVVLFYGDMPLYRPLTVSDEGDDVELLEANLASLGHHLDDDSSDGDDEVDTGFVVDGVFDDATADAVRRWQAELGVEETGVVEMGSAVVTGGPAIVSNIQVGLGSAVQAGAPIVDLQVTDDVDGFYSAHTGEIEVVVTPGPISSGQVLYTVDDRPITAVVTDETFDRDLTEGVADGDDILVLEELLVAQGYDARGDLDPDDEFDDLTTEAIEDRESDLADSWPDVEVDGVLSLDEIVIVEPGTTVGSITERAGGTVATGSELFTGSKTTGDAETAPGRVVTTAIDVAEQDKLTEGAEVGVAFPDGTVVDGTVTEIATSSTTDPADPDADPQLAAEITLASTPESAAGLNELDVEVRLVENLAEAATVIPAGALVATADGGYAVEVVEGATTSFVPVDPGMFADGFVEVTGIEPGTAVVVPS